MSVYVLSVPHTGTHFVGRVLTDVYKVETPERRGTLHTEPGNLTNGSIDALKDKKVISPLRHPYKVFASHYQRNDQLRRFGPDAVMTHVLSCFEVWKMSQHVIDATLRIDGEKEGRFKEMAVAAYNLGLETHSNMADWLEFCADWPVTGWFRHEHSLPVNFVKWELLNPYCEMWGYGIPENPEDILIRKDGNPDEEVLLHYATAAEINVTMPKILIQGTAEVRRNGELVVDEE